MRWRGGSSGTNGGVREPAVAGQFYAGRSERLAAEVDGHLAAARKVLKASDAEAPGAIGTAAGPATPTAEPPASKWRSEAYATVGGPTDPPVRPSEPASWGP